MANIAAAGAPLARARAAAILLHGRGASAEDILSLAGEFGQDDVAYLAPRGPSGSWYPSSLLAPRALIEPYLLPALAALGASVDRLARERFAADRVALIGFSQGGCLMLESVARNAKRYGAVAGLS